MELTTQQGADRAGCNQWIDGKIIEVKPPGDGLGWEVRAEGIVVHFPAGLDADPKVGQKIRVYQEQALVRGVDLDGEPIFFKTDAEVEEVLDTIAQQAEDREREEFEEHRPQMDEDYAALPDVFRQRIDIRRENNPNFRWEFEAYELFVCRQAVGFAEAALAEEEVPVIATEWLFGWAMINSDERPEQSEEWAGWSPLSHRTKDFDTETLHRIMPTLEEGHSPMSFTLALHLAVTYLLHPDVVPYLPGVLTDMVGAEAYGDPREDQIPDEMKESV